VAKTLNDSVYAGHPDFATIQDALDFANNNSDGTVLVPPGFDIDQQLTVYDGIRLKGLRIGNRGPGISAGVDTTHVILQGRAGIENFYIGTSGYDVSAGNGDGIDATGAGCVVKNVYLGGDGRHGIYTNDGMLQVTGVISNGAEFFGGDHVHLDSNSSRCVVTDNPRIYSGITNNGSNNVVADNPS